MLLSPRSKGQLLIAAGLFGMALYPVLIRVGHIDALTSDTWRGFWFGVCIGLELVGVRVLIKLKGKPRV